MAILARAAVFAALWPFYWLVVVGPVSTVHVISSTISAVRSELLIAYYSLALIFVPAYQLYFSWDRCDGFGSCFGTVIKAFLIGLVWPILLVVRIAPI